MALTTISEIFKNPKINSIIKVSGWVRTRRGSKSVSFIALNDGSTIKNLQIVAETSGFKEELLKKIKSNSYQLVLEAKSGCKSLYSRNY